MISLLQVVLLGIVQGAAELLPVSSSAHVIVAEKLMGIDPSSPEATFLLVMLHTGTMFLDAHLLSEKLVGELLFQRRALPLCGVEGIRGHGDNRRGRVRTHQGN